MTTAEVIVKEDAFQIPTYLKMPLALERGEGCLVWDAEGTRFLDFYGGHCVTLLGHCPPRVVEAIRYQAEHMLFYSNAVYSSVRANTAALLTQMAPTGLGHVFFCNSGTEAVEAALKLSRKATGRSGLLAMKGGFHGRTLGSLAATWNPAYRDPYTDVLHKTHFVPFGDLEAAELTLMANPDVAAVILEPIQSIAGIVEAHPTYYQGLRRLCDRHGVCLIFDEIQTGVGRTGTFSISEQYGCTPDLITLAKSLGSGMPVGAVLVSDEISASVEYGDQGSTFGGGMLAMAAVKATLETLVEQELMQCAPTIHTWICTAVEALGFSVRGRGCLIGVDLGMPAKPVMAALRERGVLVGGSADPHVMRLMPPLVTQPQDVDSFRRAFEEATQTIKYRP